jgi:hypothetical protein
MEGFAGWFFGKGRDMHVGCDGKARRIRIGLSEDKPSRAVS